MTLILSLADLQANMPVDSDDAIHSVHRTLQHAHDRTVTELGKSFYRNYGEYVAVAREAEQFESDLGAMRAMIAQLKGFGAEIAGSRDTSGQSIGTKTSEAVAF